MLYLRKYLNNIILYMLIVAVALQRAPVPKTKQIYTAAIILFFIWCYLEKVNIFKSVKERVGKKLIIAYGLFLCCLVPSVVCSPVVETSYNKAWQLFVFNFFPFIVTLVGIQDKKILEKLWLGILAVACVDAGVALYQALVLHIHSANGFGGQYLRLGGYLACLIPITTVWALEKKLSHWFRTCAIVTLIIFLICAFVANQSRALWCVILLALPLICFYYRRTFYCHNTLLVVSLVTAFLVGGFFYGSQKNLERLKSSVNTTTNGSNLDRLKMWNSAILMIKDFPLTGVGIENYAHSYTSNYESVKLANYVHPHSTYFLIGAEAGIPGLVAIIGATLTILFCSAKKLWRCKNAYYTLLLVGWFGFSFYSLIEPLICYESHAWLMSFLSGTFLAGAYWDKREEREHEA